MTTKPATYSVVWVWNQLVSYISYVFLTFVVVELFGIVIIALADTSWIGLLTRLIAFTPTLGLRGSGTFTLGTNEIMRFFLFWSLIAKLVFDVAAKYVKFRLPKQIPFAVFTAIHVLVAIKLVSIDRQFLQIIAMLYLFSLLCVYMYKKLNSYSARVYVGE